MRVLYLLNGQVAPQLTALERGEGHDSHLFGMLRLRELGVETDYLELERFIPQKLAAFLRKYVLTMHYAHLPLFPLFFRYDVVFTSTAYSSLILKALLRIKRFKWVILDFNILGTIGDEKNLRQRIFAWAVSRADGIVAISEAEAHALKERFPHLKEHITFLHEATDTEYFQPDKNVREQDVVLSVGNYGRDFDTVVQATEGLGVECRLATKLISPEAAKKLPPQVTVKRYPQEEMKKNYAQAKVVVVGIEKPDDFYDSVGTFAVIESLAMGKATVATDMKSMRSYITDDENGRLVPHHDVQSLRTMLIELLEQDALRGRLGIEARRSVEEFCAPVKFAEDLYAYFETLVQENERRGLLHWLADTLYCVSVRHARIMRFALSGGIAAATNLTILYTLTDIVGLWYLLSSVTAFTIAFFVNFYLQKVWTFSDQEHKQTSKKMVLFLANTLLNLFLNTTLMYLLVDGLHIWYLVAQCIVIGLLAGMNYTIYRLFIFNTPSTKTS
jgi:putative flippase GtrA/glycosyltransferase involved in cell wall biosynthesis